jgi:hypothetical protein
MEIIENRIKDTLAITVNSLEQTTKNPIDIIAHRNTEYRLGKTFKLAYIFNIDLLLTFLQILNKKNDFKTSPYLVEFSRSLSSKIDFSLHYHAWVLLSSFAFYFPTGVLL